MKNATIKQFKINEGLEDNKCPSCGSVIKIETDQNGTPFFSCNKCDYAIRQTDDYTI